MTILSMLIFILISVLIYRHGPSIDVSYEELRGITTFLAICYVGACVTLLHELQRRR